MKRFMILVTAALCISLCAGVAYAAPSVKISDKKDRVTIEEGVTAEILAQLKKEIGDGKGVIFTLKKTNNEDLAKLCAAFPGLKELDMDGPEELTTIAPMAKLTEITRFRMDGGSVEDFSPLSGLTTLTTLRARGKSHDTGVLAPDLKWMSKLTNLTSLHLEAPTKLRTLVSFEGIPALPKLTSATLTGGAPADLTPLQALSGLKSLDLERSVLPDLAPLTGLPALEKLTLGGAEVKDFSPLAGCPALKELTVSRAEKADYSTLGKLAQVETLIAAGTVGATIDDISWIPGMTNLKKLELYSQKIADYSPLAKLQLEDLTLSRMDNPADLSQLSGIASLKKLSLSQIKVADGFEGLASLVNLEALDLKDMEAKRATPVDMAFAKALINLKNLDLSGSEISGNFDAVANCVKLEKVNLSGTTGITSFDVLKKLPNLVELRVPKDTFTEAQLAGFANPKIKITQR